ncbi:MAG: hypothetical protein IVW57_17835 [Ktedonobacterales bacterium]|nr:hypothetical protein [Ktedonobacterales bacterium]
MSETHALTCRHGRYRWTEWEIVPLPDGYGVCARCDLGDHWLRASGDDVLVGTTPYPWATRLVAAWARDAMASEHSEHAEERE